VHWSYEQAAIRLAIELQLKAADEVDIGRIKSRLSGADLKPVETSRARR
jgi:hypothetical protein